jgi:hypothetical protein
MLCMKRTVNFTMSVRPALRDRIIAAAAADTGASALPYADYGGIYGKTVLREK